MSELSTAILLKRVGSFPKQIELRAIRLRDARRLASIRDESTRLHLGCGSHPKAGWVNIDLWPDSDSIPDEPGLVALNYDLTQGLPLPDDICAEIYSSHFLEHLPARAGAMLLEECHRVLHSGGRLRSCLPDFQRMARAYVAGDTEYFAPLYEIFGGLIGDGVPGSGTIMDAVNNGLYQFGEHKCMYDAEKLEKLLTAIGFSEVRRSEFDPDIDGTWDAREHFSFYLDAVK